MKMNKLYLIFIITIFSCRKEEVIYDEIQPLILNDTIISFNEDSVINEVGCYYPIDPQ